MYIRKKNLILTIKCHLGIKSPTFSKLWKIHYWETICHFSQLCSLGLSHQNSLRSIAKKETDTRSKARWPNRVADLLCSLKRKVGPPLSVSNHQGKGFKKMSYTLSSRYWASTWRAATILSSIACGRNLLRHHHAW